MQRLRDPAAENAGRLIHLAKSSGQAKLSDAGALYYRIIPISKSEVHLKQA
jgi:hypothetical protein